MASSDILVPPPSDTNNEKQTDERTETQKQLWAATEESLTRVAPQLLRDVFDLSVQTPRVNQGRGSVQGTPRQSIDTGAAPVAPKEEVKGLGVETDVD